MNQKKTARIDDLGRILIYTAVRNPLGWRPGTVVNATISNDILTLKEAPAGVNPTPNGLEITHLGTHVYGNTTTISVQERWYDVPDLCPQTGANLQIDTMGRVTLTKPLRDKLGWVQIGEGDVIEMELCNGEGVALRKVA